METTPGKRVQMLREAKGYTSLTAFAEFTKLKVGTLSALEKDKSSPSLETMAKLVESFPDLNLDWLVSGAGTMYKDDKELSPAAQLPPPVPSEAKPVREGMPAIPGIATPIQADFVGRLISQLEAENARKDALIEWLQDQNAQLLKKPLASSDAAGFMYADVATPISMRPTACQPVLTVAAPPTADTCKVIVMWAPEVEQQQAA